ncbi:MAG TPA: hypothetical protein PLF22_04375 [Pseudomonadales bacterium]|nr:hypothetical protein [Pseudomonadales bacterium]
MSFTLKKLLPSVLAASLLLPSIQAFAKAEAVEDEPPSAFAMVPDLLILRPVGMALTAIGAVVWVVALPFTAPTGQVKETGKVLVVSPAKFTFDRCLGCTRTGYHHDEE